MNTQKISSSNSLNNGTFIDFYVDVLTDLALTPLEYVVCKTLQDRTKGRGVWYGSKTELARLVGASSTYIYKVTRKLIERRLLRKVRKARKGHHYDHLALNDAFYQAVSDAQHKHHQNPRKSRKFTLLLDLKRRLGLSFEQFFSLETLNMLSFKFGGKNKQFLSRLSFVTRQSTYNYYNPKTGVLLQQGLAKIAKDGSIRITNKYRQLRQTILHQVCRKGMRTASTNSPSNSPPPRRSPNYSPASTPSQPRRVNTLFADSMKRVELERKAYSDILYRHAYRLKLLEEGRIDTDFTQVAKKLKAAKVDLSTFEKVVIHHFEQERHELEKQGKCQGLYLSLGRRKALERILLAIQRE